ncbi:MAG: GntR family transcriptional regulator, partial [Nocardioidaceae bacterium]
METSSLSHSAYRMLKSLIIRCELLPGEQVSERVLTTQYGLGRAAVRTALSRLSQDGLVRS